MRCPRCTTPLRHGRAAETELMGCVTCGGLMLEAQAMGRVIAQLDANAVGLADQAASYARHTPDVAPSAHCPVCGVVMTRLHVPHTTVDVDRCPEHGTWFDRNELQQVVHEVARARGRTVGSRHDSSSTSGSRAVVAAAGGVAAAGAAALGAHALAAHEAEMIARRQGMSGGGMSGGEVAETAVDVGEAALDVGIEVLDVASEVDVGEAASAGAELVSGGAEAAASIAEAGGSLLGGALELLAGLLDGL